jgi:hypothetical protein
MTIFVLSINKEVNSMKTISQIQQEVLATAQVTLDELQASIGQFISKVQATDGFAAKIAETVDKTMNPYGKKVAFISDKQSWILAVAAVENNITL